VYPPGVAYGVDGVLLPVHSVTVNKSISSITEASTCLTQYVNNLKVEHLDVLDNTALTAMLSVSSVRYALQSLSKKTHSETNYRQPAMESFAYDAMFYITYAQSLCSIKSLQQQLYDTMYDEMSNESLLLKTIADHSESFKNAFSCVDNLKKTCKYIY
jgi:arginyl-tRNA synthetase